MSGGEKNSCYEKNATFFGVLSVVLENWNLNHIASNLVQIMNLGVEMRIKNYNK